MKKLFIIAAMAVAAITTANAQEFKVGAKAGFLLSSVSEPEYSIIGTGTAKFNTAYRDPVFTLELLLNMASTKNYG